MTVSPYNPGDVDTAEVVEPDARCLARTAAPLDRWRRCPVHPDGAHACYQGPGHQHAKRDTPYTQEPRPDADGRVPDWATHVCDCDFAWADIVQPPRKAIR